MPANVLIAPLYNADTRRPGRLSTNERENIVRSFDSKYKPESVVDGTMVYPRVEHGEIAIYLSQFYIGDIYAAIDARGEGTGNLLDPWSFVARSK